MERGHGIVDGPIVSIDGITKRYSVRRPWAQVIRHPFSGQDKTVLDRVTFEVRTGELFGLLGPNGAGKTTLFKILSTIVLADAGQALVAGLDVAREASRARRAVAPVITEERSLAWRLSARENLRLYGALHGLERREVSHRIDALLEVVGLEDAGTRMVAKFSSGMKQRLMIARGLLAMPRVLLLDEPTRSLDPPAARRLRMFLRDEIVGRFGCTVLLATHNAEEALDLCDRVGVLHRGRLLAQGTPADLTRRYADERYRVWTTTPDRLSDAGAAALHGGRVVATHGVQPGGWHVVDVELAGGEAAAAATLMRLVSDGVEISRFERVPLPLADLIERVIARDGSDA